MAASSQKSGGSGGDTASMSIQDQIRELQREVQYNRNRIDALELSQDSYLSGYKQPHRTFSGPDLKDGADDNVSRGATDVTGVLDYMYLTAEKTIPEVRVCTFAEFKNRFDKKGRDGDYAVDVLKSGLLLRQEIQEEMRLRDKLFGDRAAPVSAKIVKDKALAKAVQVTNTTIDLINQAHGDDTWARRIRIQSPALLRILAKVNREQWSDRPRTYYRPFNSLIYQHENVKEVLQDLEEKYGAELDREGFSSISGDASLTNSSDDNSDDKYVDDSPKALACLRAYVKYIDDEVMPDYRRFENADVRSNAKVRFSDLWYLFRTGEFVYRQVDGELPDRLDFRTGKRIWKTYFVDPVPERLVAAATDDLEIMDAASRNDDAAFTIGCYYIDYTGEEYCVVAKEIKIEQFPGEVLVSSLPIFPMRFCQDWELQLEQALKTGDSLIDYIKAKHCSYGGWTLTRDPSGDQTTDEKGNLL